jgi:hypothetical protein
MCRQAAHRTCMDTQLSKGSLICEPYLLIPHVLGQRTALIQLGRPLERETSPAFAGVYVLPVG